MFFPLRSGSFPADVAADRTPGLGHCHVVESKNSWTECHA